ncbi:MAG: 50S ribosomal protein L29 [Fidelibacterota bacterium]
MRREELREMSKAELKSKLSDNLEELENLRFQKALQQLENPLRIRHLRREIAQVKTALREYELGLRGVSNNEEN